MHHCVDGFRCSDAGSLLEEFIGVGSNELISSKNLTFYFSLLSEIIVASTSLTAAVRA